MVKWLGERNNAPLTWSPGRRQINSATTGYIGSSMTASECLIYSVTTRRHSLDKDISPELFKRNNIFRDIIRVYMHPQCISILINILYNSHTQLYFLKEFIIMHLIVDKMSVNQ